jgi:hypothetical protein
MLSLTTFACLNNFHNDCCDLARVGASLVIASVSLIYVKARG